MSSRDISSRIRTRSRGSGSTWYTRHAQAVGLLPAALLVEKIHECPARLRNDRVELERFAPACLRQVEALFLIVSFPLEEFDPGGLLVGAGPHGAQVFECDRRSRRGRLGRELSHQQMSHSRRRNERSSSESRAASAWSNCPSRASVLTSSRLGTRL